MVRLVELVERIAACQGSDSYFSEAEVSAWPADLVAALRAMRLLAQASPANSIECPGCEEACVMPVHVISAIGSLPSRAVIGCDKRDDIGRVSVAIGSLARLKSSGSMLAEALAKILFLDLARPAQIDAHRWQLGQFEGLAHKSPLVLSLDTVPMLAIAGHHIKLADVLKVKKGAVVLDQPALRGMVDKPTGRVALESEALDERAKRLYEKVNALKVKGVKNYVKQVAEVEGLSEATVKNDYKKHADHLKHQRVAASSVFAQAKPPVSSRPRKDQ